MSKSSKKSSDAAAEEPVEVTASAADATDAADASVDTDSDAAESTLGIKKKSKAEREAEKKEAAAEAEREALRRRTPQAVKLESGDNPRWWVPTMLGLMVAGLVWLVVTYLSRGNYYPVPALKNWNLGVGFILIMAGFVMTTRWK